MKIKWSNPDWSYLLGVIHWASRITLEITGVKVERVDAITPEDAKAEGVECRTDLSWEGTTDTPDFSGKGYVAAFRDLWDSINGKRPGCSWVDRPWVWCIAFRRLEAMS